MLGRGKGWRKKPKIGGKSMSEITMKQMLEAGLHFGHQTRRWNPKMKPYIFGPRNGIYIINLDKSIRLFKKAYEYIIEETSKGGYVLFVGTKRQAQSIIKEEATRCGMYYINHRWLGGTLTNFQTIKKGVDRLKSIEAMQEDGSITKFPKKEVLLMEKERIKLERNIGGIKNMRSLPTVVFVIDIIPGNDDAIRAIKLITSAIAESVLDGRSQLKEKDAVVEEMVEQAMAENPEDISEGTEAEETPADEE
jgi:small subunit ribosomal protein S2